MPVVARLSLAFYEKIGEAATNELVEWLNAVDADYRSQLREINDLNFGRFDATVGQRFAEYDAKWERRFAEYDAKWERRFAEADVRLERRFASFEGRMLRWMFTFWIGTVLAMASVIFVVLRVHP